MAKKHIKPFIASAVLLLLILAVFWFVKSIKKPPVKLVVLISIDTLRADHLGCYNPSMDISPEIDRFSKDCLLFENTYCQVPLTLPSHSTMLSGTLPIYHKARDNEGFQLDDSITTLAELFKEAGFSTCGIVSTVILLKDIGIAQGFDTYIDTTPDSSEPNEMLLRRAEETTELACNWLENHKLDKGFLFVHYYDPHTPYDPPGEFASRFADDLYAGEVCYTDKHVGLLIQKIKDLGLYKNSLIVLTADHGEMLGEHGETEHGFFIYESEIRVPLLIKMPGKPRGRRFTRNAGIVDIAPTICSIAGVKLPEEFQGYNLVDYQKRNTASQDERYIYCESLYPTNAACCPLFGVVNGRWKFIQSNRPELYDIKADPKEEHNLITEEAKRAYLLKEHLKNIIEEESNKAKIDGRTERAHLQLESLGYISGWKRQDETNFDRLEGKDPKDTIGAYEENKVLKVMMKDNRLIEAKEKGSKMVSADPDDLQALKTLSEVCEKLEQFDEAKELYNRLLTKIEPFKNSEKEKYEKTFLDIHSKLADICYKQKKLDEAAEHLKTILNIDAENTTVLNMAGDLMLEKGEQDEAAKYFERSLAVDGNQVERQNQLAHIYFEAKNLQKAEELLRKAAETDPENASTFFNLGNLLFAQKRYAEALASYENAHRINPQSTQAQEQIEACRKSIEALNRIEVLKKSLDEHPRDPIIHKNLGALYFNARDFGNAAVHWEESLTEEPNQIDLLNNVAWIMSNRENESVFDPSKAVTYALKACELTEFKQPEVLDTLMGAYAAKGDFNSAIEAGEKALELEGIAEKPELKQKIQKNIDEYRKNLNSANTENLD